MTKEQIEQMAIEYEKTLKTHPMSANELRKDLVDFAIKVVKKCSKPDVSVLVSELRHAFADYYVSEGCTCCQDTEVHNKAEQKLADLLQPDQYDDQSGFDWYKYATER